MSDEVVEIREVATVESVESVKDDMGGRFDAQDAQISEVGGAVVALGDRLDEVSQQVQEVGSKVEQSATVIKASSDGVTYVALNDDQWAEVQSCWGWAKSCASFGLFLVLVCTLIVSALLGSRLWSAFSKGWRTTSA